MCRSIKVLFNFDPPATDEEIRQASEQFVRKITGFSKPSRVNEAVFNAAISNVALDAKNLLDSLRTHAEPRDRQVVAQRAHERAAGRFGGRN